jgi:CheY-like chemotaxis protein
MVLAAMLEQIGCRVDIVDDGDAARRAAARTRYDMVFMDCHMPVMDGFEATRRIRADEAERDGTHTADRRPDLRSPSPATASAASTPAWTTT